MTAFKKLIGHLKSRRGSPGAKSFKDRVAQVNKAVIVIRFAIVHIFYPYFVLYSLPLFAKIFVGNWSGE